MNGEALVLIQAVLPMAAAGVGAILGGLRAANKVGRWQQSVDDKFGTIANQMNDVKKAQEDMNGTYVRSGVCDERVARVLAAIERLESRSH